MVTRSPRDSRMAANEAAAIPLPREETTPPVTNTYLVIVEYTPGVCRAGAGNLDYSRERPWTDARQRWRGQSDQRKNNGIRAPRCVPATSAVPALAPAATDAPAP